MMSAFVRKWVILNYSPAPTLRRFIFAEINFHEINFFMEYFLQKFFCGLRFADFVGFFLQILLSVIKYPSETFAKIVS